MVQGEVRIEGGSWSQGPTAPLLLVLHGLGPCGSCGGGAGACRAPAGTAQGSPTAALLAQVARQPIEMSFPMASVSPAQGSACATGISTGTADSAANGANAMAAAMIIVLMRCPSSV
jgi:hypothetical protein